MNLLTSILPSQVHRRPCVDRRQPLLRHRVCSGGHQRAALRLGRQVPLEQAADRVSGCTRCWQRRSACSFAASCAGRDCTCCRLTEVGGWAAHDCDDLLLGFAVWTDQITHRCPLFCVSQRSIDAEAQALAQLDITRMSCSVSCSVPPCSIDSEAQALAQPRIRAWRVSQTSLTRHN